MLCSQLTLGVTADLGHSSLLHSVSGTVLLLLLLLRFSVTSATCYSSPGSLSPGGNQAPGLACLLDISPCLGGKCHLSLLPNLCVQSRPLPYMPACCIQLPTQFNWISPFKCQIGTSHSSVYTVPKWCPPRSSSSSLPPPTVPPVVSPSFRLFMPYLWITAGHLSFSHTPAQAISTPFTILIWLQSLSSGDCNDLLTGIYVSPCPTVCNNHCPFYGRPPDTEVTSKFSQLSMRSYPICSPPPPFPRTQNHSAFTVSYFLHSLCSSHTGFLAVSHGHQAYSPHGLCNLLPLLSTKLFPWHLHSLFNQLLRLLSSFDLCRETSLNTTLKLVVTPTPTPIILLIYFPSLLLFSL